MNSNIELEVDHITYIDKKITKETSNSRLWFIIKFLPKTDYQFYTTRKLSLYWFYNKILGCNYSSYIDKKINFL